MKIHNLSLRIKEKDVIIKTPRHLVSEARSSKEPTHLTVFREDNTGDDCGDVPTQVWHWFLQRFTPYVRTETSATYLMQACGRDFIIERDGEIGLPGTEQQEPNNAKKRKREEVNLVKLHSGWWVKVLGLRLDITTKTITKTILNFFSGVNIKGGVEGIHLSRIRKPKGLSIRQALVEVETQTDVVMAKKKHRELIGRREVHVVDATRAEIESVVNKVEAVEVSKGDDSGCGRVPTLTPKSSMGNPSVEDRLGNAGDDVCSFCGLSKTDTTEREYKTKNTSAWDYSDLVGFLLDARTRLNISLGLLDFNFAALDGAAIGEGVGLFQSFSARHGEGLYKLFFDHDSATAKTKDTTVNENGASSKENGVCHGTADDEGDRVGGDGRDSFKVLVDGECDGTADDGEDRVGGDGRDTSKILMDRTTDDEEQKEDRVGDNRKDIPKKLMDGESDGTTDDKKDKGRDSPKMLMDTGSDGTTDNKEDNRRDIPKKLMDGGYDGTTDDKEDKGRDGPKKLLMDREGDRTTDDKEDKRKDSPKILMDGLQSSPHTSKKGKLSTGAGKKRGLGSERATSASNDKSSRQPSSSLDADPPAAKKPKRQQPSEDLVLLGTEDDDSSVDSFHSKQYKFDRTEEGDVLILGTEEGDLDDEIEDPPSDKPQSQPSTDGTKTATDKESEDKEEGEESKSASVVCEEFSDEEDELLLKPESPPINLSEMCEPFSDNDEDDELLTVPIPPTPPPPGMEGFKDIEASENGDKKNEGESKDTEMVEAVKDDDANSVDFDRMDGSLVVLDEAFSDKDSDDDESIKSAPITKEPVDETGEMDNVEASSDDEEDLKTPDPPMHFIINEVGDDLDLDQMMNSPRNVDGGVRSQDPGGDQMMNIPRIVDGGCTSQDRGGVGLTYNQEKVAEVDRIAVIGHSYVTRLKAAHQGPVEYRGKSGDRQFEFTYFGVPGATVNSLRSSGEWGRLVLFRPLYTHLLIGGNDIGPGTKPRELTIAIKDLALAVEGEAGGKCIIHTIEYRTKVGGIHWPMYNRIRNSVNRILRKRMDDTRYRFLSLTSRPTDLDLDGVHLNLDSNQTLYQKISGIMKRFLERDAGMISLEYLTSGGQPIIFPQ